MKRRTYAFSLDFNAPKYFGYALVGVCVKGLSKSSIVCVLRLMDLWMILCAVLSVVKLFNIVIDIGYCFFLKCEFLYDLYMRFIIFIGWLVYVILCLYNCIFWKFKQHLTSVSKLFFQLAVDNCWLWSSKMSCFYDLQNRALRLWSSTSFLTTLSHSGLNNFLTFP